MANNSDSDWCHPETMLYSARHRRLGVNKLGKGANGQVFIGCTRKTCFTKYAIKKSRSDMSDEFDTLKRAYRADPNHIPKPYLFRACKTKNNTNNNSSSFSFPKQGNRKESGSIMYYEYIPSVTLSKYKKVSMKMVFEILTTVYRLNKAGIKHGDLHLSNILIKKGTNKPYITDFGRSSGSNGTTKFDYHLLLNILYNKLKPSSPVRVFIGKVIPKQYLLKNSPITRRYRLSTNSTSKLPSLREVLLKLKFNILKYK